MATVLSSSRKFKYRPLGDLASFINGYAFKPTDWEEVGLPIIRIQNLTGTQDNFNRTTRSVATKFHISDGDLLISWSASLGVYIWEGGEAVLNQHIFKAEPYDGVDQVYLYYVVQHVLDRLKAKTHGSTMKHVKRGDFEGTLVPFPMITEQRHIIDILKRADNIRRLRKQAQDTAGQLIPALFIDMFGDPAMNPKGWPVREVTNFVRRFEGGKNLKAGTDTPRNYRILKVSAVTSGIYKENESKPAPDEYSPPEKHYVRVGDLLFSRANTEALVGAMALVEKTNGKTLLPDKLWRFVLAEEIEPIYIYALFQNPSVRQELSKLSTGTSASMRNISQAKLKTLKLPVPPYEEQMKFADQVRQVQVIQTQQSISLDIATDTFKSVMSRAFSGHL